MSKVPSRAPVAYAVVITLVAVVLGCASEPEPMDPAAVNLKVQGPVRPVLPEVV